MTNRNALVSIIVPVYGTEEYLPACLDSLCGQSYSHLQIILVDDQSPDNCPKICDEYAQKDTRITVIHQKNKGVSGARNTGLTHAIGEFVMFVDSDDELYWDAVEILLRDAYKYNADLVSAELINEESACIPRDIQDDISYAVFDEEKSILLSLDGDPSTFSACAKLYRTAFIKDIRFEEGETINEDGFFVFQCCINKPVFVRHSIPVYQYNVRQGSSSRQKFSDKYLSILRFFDRKKEIIAAQFPHYLDRIYNMEVRVNLELLQVLCSTTEKKYRSLQKQCIRTVCKLREFHHPINEHYRRLEWIVTHGIYPIYKLIVRKKYYRKTVA